MKFIDKQLAKLDEMRKLLGTKKPAKKVEWHEEEAPEEE